MFDEHQRRRPGYYSARALLLVMDSLFLVWQPRELTYFTILTIFNIDRIKAMSRGICEVNKGNLPKQVIEVNFFYTLKTRRRSQSCKIYSLSFDKFYIIIEDIYGRHCIQKSSNDHLHPKFIVLKRRSVGEKILLFMPLCPLVFYTLKENLWLNFGVISGALFARALKEIKNNDVFG